MKKHTFTAILTALTLILALAISGSALAELRLPYGGGQQIGLISVVLCDELTMRERPDTGSRRVKTLKYGSQVSVVEQRNGWAYVVWGDSEDSPAGWVNADYLAIDPAWYVTEGKTPVYAWDDTSAPKVALLSSGVTLPVLKQEGKWLLISLRGATGWIRM